MGHGVDADVQVLKGWSKTRQPLLGPKASVTSFTHCRAVGPASALLRASRLRPDHGHRSTGMAGLARVRSFAGAGLTRRRADPVHPASEELAELPDPRGVDREPLRPDRRDLGEPLGEEPEGEARIPFGGQIQESLLAVALDEGEDVDEVAGQPAAPPASRNPRDSGIAKNACATSR